MRNTMIFFISIVLMSPMAYSQGSGIDIKGMEPAAKKALETFKRLVTKDNYANMGFTSLEEAASMTLDMPLEEFMVRLDRLQKYTEGDNTEKLLAATYRAVYPVLAGRNVRSSITIARIKGEWNAVSYGGANIIKLVSAILEKHSGKSQMDRSDYFIVRIPSLNLVFLSYRSPEAGLMMVPLFDDTGLSFKAGETLDSRKVFAALIPYAKAHDGLPR